MDKKWTGLLEELTNYAPRRDRDLFIEGRAQQVIASATHLINLIEENYDAETADELKRRLFNSIKSGDEGKFRRKISQIRESKKD
ncbi:MAG: hypothetical protein EOP83_11135 [Verrucomicrobiaceae bacterium]|nr:MAG: hypothetical protein EOP83_11135 [Verrucomicrobiaceae bacterium]